MKTPLLFVLNWKQNPSQLKDAEILFKDISKLPLPKLSKMVVCPPSIFINHLSKLNKKKGTISVGVQDVSLFTEGAHTGEISASMIRSSGAQYAIVGHSERRKAGETSDEISQKIKLALKAHLIPIVCVGEKIRDEQGTFWIELKEDIQTTFNGIPKPWLKDMIVAYEPLWAIGSDATRQATGEEIEAVIIFIKRVLADMYGVKAIEHIKVLYGGSVDSKNIKEYSVQNGVAGFLIGRAGLKTKELSKIVNVLS